eukprot:SAG31_NODE_5437_length_2538_cov_6.138581_2_plen_97_part_00
MISKYYNRPCRKVQLMIRIRTSDEAAARRRRRRTSPGASGVFEGRFGLGRLLLWTPAEGRFMAQPAAVACGTAAAAACSLALKGQECNANFSFELM